MAPEKGYVVKEGSKIFLPIQYVQKEDEIHCDISDDLVAEAATDCTNEVQDAVENRVYGHSGGSNMLEILFCGFRLLYLFLI